MSSSLDAAMEADYNRRAAMEPIPVPSAKLPVPVYLRPDCEDLMPKYAHETDSGADLFAAENAVVHAGDRALITTGVIVRTYTRLHLRVNSVGTEHALLDPLAVPVEMEIQVRPKSGLALKRGITVLNTPGTVDRGYRGEIGVILFNTSNQDFEIRRGDKIAQIVGCLVVPMSFLQVTDVDKTDRGEGAYGSTGTSNCDSK